MKLVKTIFLSFLLLALPSSAGWREVDAVDFVAGGGAVMHVDDATGRHTMRAVDGVWNFGIEFASSNPNFREAGMQNAVNEAIVSEWGSPLQRMGAYGNAGDNPVVVDGTIVDALWDLGAAATVYKNLGAKEITRDTEIVQRAMSRAELENIKELGVLSREGRSGNHYVSDAINSSANRARQRLGLPVQPEVRTTLEVPSGVFSSPSRVQPYVLPNGQVLPGGGMERIAPGTMNIPVRIINVLEY